MKHGSGSRWWAATVVIVAAVGGAVIPAPGARADEKVDEVNAAFRNIRQSNRSDLILLPALVGLQEPPEGLMSVPTRHSRFNPLERAAMLLPAGSAAWPAVEEWAMAEPQRAALEALRRATANEDGAHPMAFGQPYGVEGISLELVRAGLYTELGDPPLLAAARYGYLPALDRLLALAHVEATRLNAAGQVKEAMEVAVDALYLGRQIADRQFVEEVDWGLRRMIAALQRIRDLAYVDFTTSRKLTDQDAIDLIKRLDESAGFLRIDRVNFPRGERIAAEQVVATVYTPRGGPNDAFAGTMAALASSQHPLRLFSEAAKWESAGSFSGDWFDITAALKRVADDWEARWPLQPFDRRMAEPFAYDRLDPMGEAVLLAVFDPVTGDLFSDRQMLRAEAVGTRAALAVIGYTHRNGEFPRQLSALRPRYIPQLEADPYNASREFGAKPPLEYFVPIRDTRDQFGEREEPRPHRINIVVLDGQNFSVNIGQDQFILYSVGPDGGKDWARTVREDARDLFRGDYLIWPPIVSLQRQHLQEIGAMP